MQDTLQQYDSAVMKCRSLFAQKTLDYGTAWRILRPTSLTDQLFIKAKRIRMIEELATQKVNDSITDEFIGLVNYSALALIQLELPESAPLEVSVDEVLRWYDEKINDAKELMVAKNHDYGEVWREMRVSSFTDLILMKLLRIKKIEDNAGKTLVSEGLKANYSDIINYAIFALIKLEESA